MIRANAVSCLRPLLVALLLSAAGMTFVASAQAAAPAWRVLGVTAPTNLPPVNNEIQRLAVDATGGTFTLTFDSQTTGSLAFDATPGEISAALNGLASIGGAGGSVEVSGGPGAEGATTPYFVRFGGSLSGIDVPEMTADSSLLSGGAATATVSTKVQGGTAGSGQIVISVANVGGLASSGTVTLNIGPLPTGIATSATPTGTGWTCTPPGAGQTSATCTRTGAIQVENVAPRVTVPVTISSLASPTSTVPLSVEGGGAFADPEGNNQQTMPVTVSAEPAPPGVQGMWAAAFDADGRPMTQAGGHPQRAGAFFRLNSVISPSGQIVPAGDLRDVDVELPPGFLGNPMVTSRCPQEQLVGGPGITACTADSIVGRAQPYVGGIPAANNGANNPVYNNEPAFGYAAQFTFRYVLAQSTLVGSLRSDSDYGVTVSAPNLPLYFRVWGAFSMLNGNPAGAGGKAFLTNPTNCAEQAEVTPITTIAANTWQQPSIFDRQAVDIPAVTGCDKLVFEPDFKFQPSASQAASPSGATANLTVPQDGLTNPSSLATPHLRRSVVALPAGLTLNPSAADGLAACSTEQIGLIGTGMPMPNPIRFNQESPTCPDASKIGTVEIETPLLEDTLQGVAYLAAQGDNPFKSLLAMYLVIDDPKTGIVAKLPGEVKPDPQTGQLTAVFDSNPQVPFSDLRVHFRGGGPRSTLATPDVCGTYATAGEFTPWSAPESGPPATTQDSFMVSSGPGGSACASSKAARPFAPRTDAGTAGVQAGAFSPFVLRINRSDGDQELKRVELNLPPGLTGKLAGVATCSDAAIDAAKRKSGKAEQAGPSCSAASRIGTVRTRAGVGGSPIQVVGQAYLAGPYAGAPVSVAVITPAVAGPFDLGNVVIRTPLFVNPKTAQLRAVSDEIPHILEGIPLQVRSIEIEMDRPDFTLNPTNCERMQVGVSLAGAGGDVLSAADDVVSSQAVPFQVGNCEALGFKPNVRLKLKGGTKRDRYQQLTAIVTARPGDANIARASVNFPPAIFLAQEHIQTICTRVQFAAEACPKASIYGFAEAITPLLDQPLKGPVYLRSSDNLLPDLVAALQGPTHQPIEVELSGRTDSKNQGLRNTFDVVPDAPVSRFTLRMQGGKKSLLVTSQNLCRKKQRATVRMKGQNGKPRNFRPVIKTSCRKR